MNNIYKVSAFLLAAAVIGGVIGYNIGVGSQKSLNIELDTILKKIALLEKIGVEIDWDEIIDNSFFKQDLINELKREIEKLGENLLGKGSEKNEKSSVGSDFPRPIPNPVGWERKLLDNGMVEFTRNREVWWWNPLEGKWQLPPGITHPDPNPITPTGERLAGPDTM